MIHKFSKLTKNTAFAFIPLSTGTLLLLGGCITSTSSYTDDSAIVNRLDEIMAESQTRASAFHKDRTAKVGIATPTKGDLWWEGAVAGSLKEGADQPISLEGLYVQALKNSSQIRVFSDIPLIRETGIQEAKGAFDTNLFVDTKYSYTDDPVGSTLTTGNVGGRFIQREFSSEAGVRKKTITGAEVTLSQEADRTGNNSSFFTPNPQGTARLKLSVVQPILRGAGIAYNRAVLDIARIDSEIAQQELIRQVEGHLLEIARSYWSLYLARVGYLQKQRLYEQANTVASDLKARSDVDALKGQTARADAAVAERKADLVRSELAISNAQDRLRALVNDPSIGEVAGAELLPVDRLMTREYPVNYERAAQHALVQRPEVSQAFMQVRAAAVREKMQKNEVLPILNMLVEGYVAGLANHGNTGEAVTNQFSKGGPGGAIGFHFEFPIENNVADARYTRRRLELRQQVNQLKTTIETVLLEVKVSAREVHTSWRDYNAKLESVQAAEQDLAQFTARKEVDTTFSQDPLGAPATSTSNTSAYLDSWLDAQQRLSSAEEELARAASVYQVSVVNFERAQGNLLNYEDVTTVRRTDQDGLPVLELQKRDPNRK